MEKTKKKNKINLYRSNVKIAFEVFKRGAGSKRALYTFTHIYTFFPVNRMYVCTNAHPTKITRQAGGANIVTQDVTGEQRKPCWVVAAAAEAKHSDMKKCQQAKINANKKKISENKSK